jgi:hypothetical protein
MVWCEDDPERDDAPAEQTISNIESGKTGGVDFTVPERLARDLGAPAVTV